MRLDWPFAAASERPLSDAIARVKRAHEHIGEISSAITDIQQVEVELHDKPSPMPGHRRLSVTLPGLGFDPPLSVYIGEALYNLRAALDYVVYDLARANNGWEHVSGTQFPVDDDPEVFEARQTGKTKTGRKVARYLKKVPAEHVNAIRQLQPFEGCEWTKELVGLQNPDKHRQLVPVMNRLAVASEDGTLDLPPMTGDDVKTARVPLGTLGVPDVVFAESGGPVRETLDFFHAQVRSTVEAFQGAFDSGASAGD